MWTTWGSMPTGRPDRMGIESLLFVPHHQMLELLAHLVAHTGTTLGHLAL